jgi:DNA-binding GntR family transcriptional regulator
VAPDAHTGASVYGFIKSRIVRGAWPVARPLNLRQIAEGAGTSIVPVRDALQRLVGERIVETRAGGGFQVPALSPAALADLYAWHGESLRLAVRSWTDRRPVVRALGPAADASAIADLTADVFEAIASASSNVEHAHAVRSAGDRLHVFRLAEYDVLRTQSELAAIINLVRSGPTSGLQSAMAAYHHWRVRSAATLVRAAIVRAAESRMSCQNGNV